MASVSNNALSRDIGNLQGRMQNTEERLKTIEAKIDLLVEAVAQSKGGLRTLIAVSSVIAAITASLASFATWLIGRH